MGLPKEFSIDKCRSLGLRLVNTITKEQLEGELFINSNKGADFLITFTMK